MADFSCLRTLGYAPAANASQSFRLSANDIAGNGRPGFAHSTLVSAVSFSRMKQADRERIRCVFPPMGDWVA